MLLLDGDAATINLFAELVKQSPLIAALVVAIKYLMSRQKDMETKLQTESDKREKYMADDRGTLLGIVNNSTSAIKDSTAAINAVTQYLKTKEAHETRRHKV